MNRCGQAEFFTCTGENLVFVLLLFCHFVAVGREGGIISHLQDNFFF